MTLHFYIKRFVRVIFTWIASQGLKDGSVLMKNGEVQNEGSAPHFKKSAVKETSEREQKLSAILFVLYI